MNVLSFFPSVTDDQPIQGHLLSKTTISTQSSISQETQTMNMQSKSTPASPMNAHFKTIFANVTDKQPFEDHLLGKTIVLTQRTLVSQTI